jgi:lipoate-protein ligase A
MILRILKLRHYPIFKQLKLEEALMRVEKSPTHAYFLLNEGTPQDCVIMGSSGNANDVLHMENIRQDKFPVIRRFTGGGTVIVSPKTAFVSIVASFELLKQCTFPEEEAEERATHSLQEILEHEKEVEKYAIKNVTTDPSFEKKKKKVFLPYPKDIMLWSEHFYMPIFPKHVQFSLKENDYVFGNKKFGGNAQYVTGGLNKRFTHHTSFLWDYDDLDMHRYLKLPSKRPAYRADRIHGSFLIKMKDMLRGEYSPQDDRPGWFLDKVEKHIHDLAEGGEWSHNVKRVETIYESDDQFKELLKLVDEKHMSQTYWSYNVETGDDEYKS